VVALAEVPRSLEEVYLRIVAEGSELGVPQAESQSTAGPQQLQPEMDAA
jgi:hypothetical protein